MARKRRKIAKKKGPKTVFDKLNDQAPGFLEGIMSRKPEDLKNLIVKLELEDKEIEEARKEDTDLNSLTERQKVAKETYTVPLGLNRLKRRAIAQILEERGKA